MSIEIKRERRLYIRKADIGRGVIMAFPTKDGFHVIEHDQLVAIARKHANYLNSRSWRISGAYSIDSPNANVRRALEPYRIPTFR